MWVCLCNDLSVAAVEDACSAGARRVAEVFRRHACTPICGNCVETIRTMLDHAREDEEE
ncbi:MAG: (2Fe-2S)-binding protein [Alphaproteobacteria bacterium]|nr:(2Fe-2S)-binding protein [Alphaproteobacteria bacterium]MCY4230512.1 (2Fe-2S)-binding protein [Alphaproteobacteria bacterium]MCY4318135.1 (2Fe-2S)-binding protein [Alphaproteobacteria bacterium]